MYSFPMDLCVCMGKSGALGRYTNEGGLSLVQAKVYSPTTTHNYVIGILVFELNRGHVSLFTLDG